MERMVDKWDVSYEDSQLEIRVDPREEDGYVIVLREREEYISLPRGCLREVVRADRPRGREILERLLPYHLNVREVFNGTDLSWDSLLAATAKAYIAEEEKREQFSREL